jgi:hypothetical protein
LVGGQSGRTYMVGGQKGGTYIVGGQSGAQNGWLEDRIWGTCTVNGQSDGTYMYGWVDITVEYTVYGWWTGWRNIHGWWKKSWMDRMVHRTYTWLVERMVAQRRHRNYD